MNPLERSLIKKAGYANGWENVRESTPEWVVMFSARHKAVAHVTPAATPGAAWRLDALYDSSLITFNNEGFLVPSNKLTQEHHAILGFAEHLPLRLRWASPQHLPYLAWYQVE
jgi:hypothetical protein